MLMHILASSIKRFRTRKVSGRIIEIKAAGKRNQVIRLCNNKEFKTNRYFALSMAAGDQLMITYQRNVFGTRKITDYVNVSKYTFGRKKKTLPFKRTPTPKALLFSLAMAV